MSLHHQVGLNMMTLLWKYMSKLQFPVQYRFYSSIAGLWCGIFRDTGKACKNLSTKYQSASDGAGISQFKL